ETPWAGIHRIPFTPGRISGCLAKPVQRDGDPGDHQVAAVRARGEALVERPKEVGERTAVWRHRQQGEPDLSRDRDDVPVSRQLPELPVAQVNQLHAE